MAWVVDTCLLIDVAEGDPAFGAASAALIDARRPQGLAVCPVTYAELAPVFNGDATAQNEFLRNLGVAWPETWTLADTLARATDKVVAQTSQSAVSRVSKPAGKLPKRPVADVLIDAFASRFDGFLTRNQSDSRPVFPTLNIVVP
jgi:hypothetical protein